MGVSARIRQTPTNPHTNRGNMPYCDHCTQFFDDPNDGWLFLEEDQYYFTCRICLDKKFPQKTCSFARCSFKPNPLKSMTKLSTREGLMTKKTPQSCYHCQVTKRTLTPILLMTSALLITLISLTYCTPPIQPAKENHEPKSFNAESL